MAETPVPAPATTADTVRAAFEAAAASHDMSPEQVEDATSRNPMLDLIPEREETQETEEVAAEAPSATPEATDPPPTEGEKDISEDAEANASIPVKYFEVHLTEDGTAEGTPLPADVRKSIIGSLKGRDLEIQAAKRREAELRNAKPEQEKEQTPEPKPADDDQLMEAFGYDKEDPMYDVKKEVAAPLLRQVAGLSEAVQSLTLAQQAEQFEGWWNTTLNDLEKQYGELSPLDIESDATPREQLLDWAIENEVFDPTDAYNRVTVPARRTISMEAEKRRKSAAEQLKTAKPKPSQIRPKGGAGEPKATDMMSVPEAAAAAAKRAGVDWGTALSGPL